MALWLFIAERGPWHFMGADVYHLTVPTWLLALAFAAVPATALLREHRLAGNRTSAAGLLLLLGNAAALLGPALFLDDLTLIYTLSASFHGIQYLAYLGERERADNPAEHPTRVLVPLVSAIVLSMIGWFAAFVPAKTPKPIIDKLNGAIKAAIQDKAVEESLLKAGIEPLSSTPEWLGGA